MNAPARPGAASVASGPAALPIRRVGVVAALARYPVKSMGGEHLAQVEVEPRGVVGDRCWAAYTADGGIGSGETTRRFRRVDGLLAVRARLEGDVPVVELPTGQVCRADDPEAAELLSAIVRQPLVLRREAEVRHHDECPVHLITTAGVRRLGHLLGAPVDVARFRANIVLDVQADDFAEDAWKGRALHVGNDVVLHLGEGMPRCVMVGLPQPRLGRDAQILKELARTHQVQFGLQAHVAHGGTVRRGDLASLA